MVSSISALLGEVAAVSFGVQVLLVDRGMAFAADVVDDRPAITAVLLTLLSSVPVL
jgi:hypothetical protein